MLKGRRSEVEWWDETEAQSLREVGEETQKRGRVREGSEGVTDTFQMTNTYTL